MRSTKNFKKEQHDYYNCCDVSLRATKKRTKTTNVGRIALERLVRALINYSLLQLGGGVAGTMKFTRWLQITSLEVNIYHYYDLK